MIGKKTFKLYEIKSIEDYFNLIVDSRCNGNYADTISYIKRLSKSQKKLLINYLAREDFKAVKDAVKDVIINITFDLY